MKDHQLNEEEKGKIIAAFKDKDWNQIKSTDSWVIFKVMAEMVEGFEKMAIGLWLSSYQA